MINIAGISKPSGGVKPRKPKRAKEDSELVNRGESIDGTSKVSSEVDHNESEQVIFEERKKYTNNQKSATQKNKENKKISGNDERKLEKSNHDSEDMSDEIYDEHGQQHVSSHLDIEV